MGRFRLAEALWVVLSFSVNTSDAFRARSRAMSLLGASQTGIKHVERHMMGAQVAEKTISKLSVTCLSDNDLRGKTVLVRCDLNVPLDGSRITDDTRIRESLPTIDLLRSKGAKVVLASHLGRPKGKPDANFSLLPVAGRLSELIGQKVDLAPDCVGPAVQASMKSMKEGDVLLLENVRFHSGETDNSPEFSKRLSEGVDIFVNDAFGTAHRAHSSTAGICSYVERSAAGLLLQKELEYLQGAVESPKRPFMAIVGGSKVSTKMGVLKALVNKVDKLVLGGAMVFTFFKAEGVSVGSSLVEDDKMELAMEIKKMASDRGVELILPVDVVVGDSISKDAKSKIVDINGIEDGWLGLDNGPKTNAMIEEAMAGCSTILWNGPMGVSEFEQFAAGTESVAKTLAALTKTGTTSIVGGGDSVAAVQRMGLGPSMSHVSTGGGASLELLEGKVLPGVAALSDA